LLEETAVTGENIHVQCNWCVKLMTIWFFESFCVHSSLKYCDEHFWNIGSTEKYVLHMQVLLKCCYIKMMESSQWENFVVKFRFLLVLTVHCYSYKTTAMLLL
jgi:hypothetical protein